MYNSLKGMLREVENFNGDLAELIIANEISKTEKTREDVIAEMTKRRGIMKDSSEAATGRDNDLQKTFISGMSADQQEYTDKNDTLCGGLVNKAMAKALSCSEVNAAMGKICAMPTAGSCGIVPAVLETLAEELGADDNRVVKAYVVASGTGALAVENATVSGAEGGCQAECGVAAAMAAAGAVYMKGGSAEECIESFAISLINIMGLVCDPVAGLVQIPCAQRNASQAVNALLSADLAMGGMKCGIDADEVIESMYRVGKLMPVQHRETSLGGIAVTASAKEYEEALKNM
ncbi:L-serine ammonia-lyase, iron-sulfur-dependent, subunit alpha [Gallibacter intestinalis]|uniref:L-serine dehydratase n=1 Tax=Gallibacter intestinalis TaxID=2779356 RepID=A0ABR9QX85_9FIRM|nr:L-serine ammonia-lyase, iron-sulfur-dependent, subunit alpha [Gallibacter intestinalis]MBE5035476.1 L-serine ammonia-lyase, iron-sulfur-dependent, subunit alpha [Gallibacter intestinalis]